MSPDINSRVYGDNQFFINEVVLGFIVIILIFFMIAAYRILKKKEYDDISRTLCEMLPVLGLIGTLAGAGYIEFVKDQGNLKQILLATVASLAAWFFYLIINIISAYYGSDSSKGDLKDTEELSSINKITSAIASNISQIDKSLSSINNNYNTLVNLNSGKNIKSIEEDARAFNDQIKIGTADIKNYLLALSKLKQMTNQDFNIKINESDDFSITTRKIIGLSNSLKNLRLASSDLDIHFKVDSNVPNPDKLIQNIADALAQVKNSDKDVDININIPPSIQKYITDIDQLSKVLEDIREQPSHLSFDFELLGDTQTTIDNLFSLNEKLSAISNQLNLINQLPKTQSISLNIPQNINSILTDMEKMINLLQELSHQDNNFNFSFSLNGHTESIVNQMTDIYKHYKPLQLLERDLNFRILFDTSENFEKTIAQIQNLSVILDELRVVAEELENKLSLDYSTNKILIKLRDLLSEINKFRIINIPGW